MAAESISIQRIALPDKLSLAIMHFRDHARDLRRNRILADRRHRPDRVETIRLLPVFDVAGRTGTGPVIIPRRPPPIAVCWSSGAALLPGKKAIQKQAEPPPSDPAVLLASGEAAWWMKVADDPAAHSKRKVGCSSLFVLVLFVQSGFPKLEPMLTAPGEQAEQGSFVILTRSLSPQPIAPSLNQNYPLVIRRNASQAKMQTN